MIMCNISNEMIILLLMIIILMIILIMCVIIMCNDINVCV